jgi:CheY-like chemotaxis protein/HPt (histidine-containing phosphotransfer) domain-containing protein
MFSAGQHLLEMIDRVLDLSEIESECVELRTSSVDLRELANTCLDFVRPSADTKGLTLRLVDLPSTPDQVTVDPTRLRQIVLNLLGNAIKFTETGSIELRLRRADYRRAVRIEIADTGPGVPQDQQYRLFQEFDRLDREMLDPTEGAGLGLTISARLIAVMGGRIGFESNPGGGSIFWLELPLTSSNAGPVHLKDLDPSVVQSLPTRPLRVLVADDVAMNRDIASSFLSGTGHEIVCAQNGVEAVEAVTNSDFDVVLMDVRMPGMDGLEATRHIRALPGGRGRVPIVALTAQNFTEQLERCRQTGIDFHLTKPYTLDALMAVVAQAAAMWTASDEANGTAEPDAAADQSAVFDRGAFDRTASALAPEQVASYVKSLAASSENLLRGLRGIPTSLPAKVLEELADSAHALAGSAGMFGLSRLAAEARQFERSVQTGAADIPTVVDRLDEAIEASLHEIRQGGLAASGVI